MTTEAKWRCCSSPRLVVAIDPLQRQVVVRLPPEAHQQEIWSLCFIKRLFCLVQNRLSNQFCSLHFSLQYIMIHIMTNHCKSKESWTSCPPSWPVINLITCHLRSCHSLAPPQLAMAMLMCRIVTSHFSASKSCTSCTACQQWNEASIGRWIYGLLRMQRSNKEHPSIPNCW